MPQSGRDDWVLFSQHDRGVVDTTSEQAPLPYGTGNPKRLRELILSLNVNTVLDLGCSAACWYSIFEGCKYYGIDQDLEIFVEAKKNAPCGIFVQGCGENIPFKSSKFDLIFTSHVLQHNDHYPEKDIIVREINRVLRTTGYFLMVESTSEDAVYTDQTFSKTKWQEFITERGFKFIQHGEPEEYLFQKVENVAKPALPVLPYRSSAI